MSEDREVGGHVHGGRRESWVGLVVVVGGRNGEETEEVQSTGTSDSEGFDDELAPKSEALDFGAGLEGELSWCGSGCLIVGMLVLLLLVDLVLLLEFLFHGLVEGTVMGSLMAEGKKERRICWWDVMIDQELSPLDFVFL